jgi:hypothetical protein
MPNPIVKNYHPIKDGMSIVKSYRAIEVLEAIEKINWHGYDGVGMIRNSSGRVSKRGRNLPHPEKTTSGSRADWASLSTRDWHRLWASGDYAAVERIVASGYAGGGVVSG